MAHLNEKEREKKRKAAITAKNAAITPKTPPAAIASQPPAAWYISKYDMTGSPMLSAPK